MGTLTSLKENWLFSHIGLLVLFLIFWYCIWSKWIFQQLKVWWWPISKRQSWIIVHIVATVTCYVNVCDMAQASILTQLVAAAWRKFEGFFREDQHVLADGSIWSYPAYWQRASERWFWLGRWPLQGAAACPWWGISLSLCCLVSLRPKFFFLITLILPAAIIAVPKVLILSNMTYVATSAITKATYLSQTCFSTVGEAREGAEGYRGWRGQNYGHTQRQRQSKAVWSITKPFLRIVSQSWVLHVEKVHHLFKEVC